MSDVDELAERGMLRFLERLLTDRAAGRERTLEEYQAAFPGLEGRIAEELDAAGGPPPEPRSIGPYRLIRELGRGGQGVVHLAHDERLGRTVALKLLPRALAGEGARLPARLAREMEVLSRLDHPGICVVFDAGEVDGYAFLAMRYVPGVSLAQRVTALRAAGPRGSAADSSSGAARDRVRETVQLVERLARALHAAHEAGVIHRDVKPANVIVHESGQPVLLDFGLARADESALPSLTRTGDRLGTPHYMAPECLRGEEEVDARADVWSLGVTLYELLTGARPFEGRTIEAVARRVREVEPEDPRHFDRAISRDLAVVVARALEKSPGRRYPDAAAFADDLARVRAGEPVRARAISRPERALRWARRNPTASVLLVSLVFALVASLLVGRELRRLGEERADALEESARHLARSDAHLARSEFESARLLATSGEHGRTWRVLELVRNAVERRGAAVAHGEALPVGTPSVRELRDLAAWALLEPDAKLVTSWEHERPLAGAFDRTGSRFAGRAMLAGAQRVEISGVVTARFPGPEAARAWTADPRLRGAEEGLALSNDEDGIAVLTADERTVEWWTLPPGDEPRGRYELPQELWIDQRTPAMRRQWKLAFSPDDAYLAAATVPHEGTGVEPTSRGFAVWDTETGRCIAGSHGGDHAHAWLGFSPDSRLLVVPLDTASAGVVVLDAEPGLRHRLDFDQPLRRMAAAGADDGRLFALVGRDTDVQDTLLVLHATSGAYQARQTRALGCRVAAFAEADLVFDEEHDALLFADTARGLRLVKASDGAALLHIEGAHDVHVGAIAVDGGSISSHGRAGRTRRWLRAPDRGLARPVAMPLEAPTPGERPRDRGDYHVVSDSGSRAAMVAAVDYESVWTWECDALGTTWTQLIPPASGYGVPTQIDVLEHADGWTIGRTSDRCVTLWRSGGEVRDVAADEGCTLNGGAFSADAAYEVVESSGDERRLLRVPIDGGEPERIPLAVEPGAWWVDASPGGRRLLVRQQTEAGHSAALVDGGSGASLPLDLGGGVVASAEHGEFTPSGRLVSLFVLSDAWELRVWDAESGAPVAAIPFEGKAAGQRRAIHADRWLAVAGRDGTAVLYDLGTGDGAGEELLRWEVSLHEARMLQFLADGRLVTWDGIGPQRIWDLERMRAELDAHAVGW